METQPADLERTLGHVLVLTSGIPRSGTGWMNRVARSLLKRTGWVPEVPGESAPDRYNDYPTNARGDRDDVRLRAALSAHAEGPARTWAAKTHYFPGSALTTSDAFRVIWVYRDLYDVMASTCHFAVSGQESGAEQRRLRNPCTRDSGSCTTSSYASTAGGGAWSPAQLHKKACRPAAKNPSAA